ncbi:hypothetical protein [Chryseobacterium indoltheticum]|uniref:hypothetical protein n=1 Tax=Chryseobacterium indoltheticum TaxID=254 RepID=UPI003F49337C
MINDVVLGNSISVNIDNRTFLEKEIQEVNNGSQVLQKIEYRNMHPELFYYYSYNPDQLTYIYKSQDLKYPFYVHKLNPSLNLVNKIHTIFDGKILSKEYRYENGIQNLEGKGFMGFQKTYSSDPYESEIKNGKYINKNPAKGLFWKIETRDPLMDNSTVKSTYGGINKFFTEDTTINKNLIRGIINTLS